MIATAVAVPLCLSPVSFDSYLLPKRVLFQVLTLLLGSVWMAYSMRFFVPRRDALWWPIAFFLGWCALSIAISFHSFRQIRDFAGPVLAVLFWVISRRLWQTHDQRQRLVSWLYLPVFCIALYAVLQDFGIDWIRPVGGVEDWRARIASTMGNPNFVAGYLIILFPVLIARGCRAGVSRWWFLLMTVPVTLLCVAVFVVTFCVGAFISLIFALLLCIFLSPVRKGLSSLVGIRLGVLLLMCAGVVSFYCTHNPYNGRDGSVLDQASASPRWRTGFAARQFNWRTTRLMIEDRPFVGIGFASFQAQSMTYQGMNYERQGREHPSPIVKLVDQPHHQLLETAAETGIPGVFFLSWLLVSVVKASLRTVRRVDRESRSLLAAVFLGFMIAIFHALSSFPFHLPASTLAALVWLSVLLPAKDTRPDRFASRSFRPIYGILLCVVLMIPLSLPFVSNIYLRRGYEARRYGVLDILNLQTAVRLDPLEPMNHVFLGEAYYNAGHLKEAANAYFNGLELQEDFSSHLALRDICARLGAVEAMIAQQRDVVRLNPGYIPYREELERMCRKYGMEAEAEQIRRSIDALSRSG
ncbi:MAG: O-antigen ligase family protein [bacterium]